LDQDRTTNTVNEITAISNTIGAAWKQPGYDAAGNMTSLPQPLAPTSGYLATYDAWHRLVKLRTDVTTPVTVAEYAYDGITRRTLKKSYSSGTLSETRHYYYSAAWQVLEERIDTATNYARQYVWGLRYIDDCVLRDLDSSGDKTRVNVLQDANWNVTAITLGTPVAERYAYSPYGQPTFLYPDFTAKAVPGEFEWDVLYAGYKRDAESGLFQVRFRYLHPTLGNWVTRDPIGYWAGDTNLYQNVQNNGISNLDPLGLKKVCCEFRDGYIIQEVWTQEFDCDANCSAEDCCKAEANAWLRWWRLLRSHDGPCDKANGGGNLNPPAAALAPAPALIPKAAPATGGAAAGSVFGRIVPAIGVGIALHQIFKHPTDWLFPEEKEVPKKPQIKVDPPPVEGKKKHKYRCTIKARDWPVGTPCYDQIFEGFGQTEREAKDAAQRACHIAGCHAPGRGGNCGHNICQKLP
jgi:RHS repeat-associated protein